MFDPDSRVAGGGKELAAGGVGGGRGFIYGMSGLWGFVIFELVVTRKVWVDGWVFNTLRCGA